MVLAQTNFHPGTVLATLAIYGLLILVIFLVQVAVLRWIIRVNDIVKNQQEMIKLLREFVRQR